MNSGSDRRQGLWRLMRDKAPEGWRTLGAADERIDQCEQRLGVTLPASYREFLREIGAACWPDGDIYGILPGGGLQGPSVIGNTEEWRSIARPRMPHHLIPFHPDGWGNHYCLDTSQMVEEECPVVFWNHDEGEEQQPERTHDTFLDWLEKMIEEELEYESRADRDPPA